MGKYDLNQGNIITPVQSTFVDPGVETFKQAAMLYRQQYDKNKDAYNLTKRAMAQMELMPGDEEAGLRDQFTGQLDKNFEDILATGAFEDATNAVQANVDFVMTDKTVLQAQRNALEFKKEEALIEQFGPSGVLDFNKGLRESFTTVTTDAEGNKVVNSYKEKMEQREDYNAHMKNLIGNIAEEGWGGASGVDINGDDVIDYLQTNNTKGVSQAKMERVVNNLLNNYLDSKAGDQDMRRLTQIEGMSTQEAKADILNRMKGVAQPQVGMTPTVSHQQYKLNTGSSYYGAGSKYGTEDNWAVNTLSDEKTNIGYQLFADMNFATESEKVEGGVIITGQKGIVFDYSTFVSSENRAKVNQGLIESGAATTDNADMIQTKMLEYLQAEEMNDIEKQKRISAELGISFDNERAKLQTMSKIVKSAIDTERLGNLGTMLHTTEVDGVFRPNQGATANTTFINGNAIVDGEYWFTETQLNNMAKNAGLGETGWADMWGLTDVGATDIDNIEDAQGNKVFIKKEGKDGTTYYAVRGKSARIKGDKIPGDAFYKAGGHTDSQFKENEHVIGAQRDAALYIAQSADFAFQATMNRIPGAGPKLGEMTKNVMNELKRMDNILGLPNPVDLYQSKAREVSNIIVNEYNKGTSDREIEQILVAYVNNLRQQQTKK